MEIHILILVLLGMDVHSYSHGWELFLIFCYYKQCHNYEQSIPMFVSIGCDLCLERRFLEDLLDQNPRHIGRQLFPACFHKDPLRTNSIG